MHSPLWSPDARRIESTLLHDFMQRAAAARGRGFADYADLHRWSVEEPEAFWERIWDDFDVVASARGERVVVDKDRLPGARWFPDAKLNFAENLLKRRDDAEAVVFRGERGVTRVLTHRELYETVSRLSRALRDAGLRSGDRVAGFMPNVPETVIAMLAATAAGGVWSSCSPDFGAAGVLDRFGQIEPKFLFAADGYEYNGKRHDCLEKLARIRACLPGLERVVVVPFLDSDPDLRAIPGATPWPRFLAPATDSAIEFTQCDFDHPLYVMYSSGTTGAPKCIVHGVGGTLLQHLKEHRLHCDVKPGDRLFYFTTCGWMMWNWLVSGLASGATIMLYDGSPFHPDGNALFDYARDRSINIFGASAKFIDACAKAGLEPARTHDLGALRTLLSTGSPLSPEGFEYAYAKIGRDLCLSSISGGTDIMSCFVGGAPILPVWSGEIQATGLGMDVQVRGENGARLADGEKGELCCANAFPSMPIGFWNDPDGSRYRAAYFEKIPGVWCHGDYVSRTARGGWIVYGRSDAVLNPGGVRIGTAEIYRQAEKVDEVVESLVIGQGWRNDVRVVLFVRLKEGVTLDDALRDRIRDEIRANATPRHVPARIVQVADIPRTRSGKIVELAVRAVVHGEPVGNREALANPEALELFRGLPELEDRACGKHGE